MGFWYLISKSPREDAEAIGIENEYYNDARVLGRKCHIVSSNDFFFRYGLLGPSGCGKTTLLHCIVGRSELDSGEIQVKAKKKANVGYMPQVSY